MKIPDIGDVMNKFEVLGIVGEGERSQGRNVTGENKRPSQQHTSAIFNKPSFDVLHSIWPQNKSC